jgi:hypothetical protein
MNELDPSVERDFDAIIKSIKNRGLVFFLGAGANLCDRGENEKWIIGENLPSGAELAHYLAPLFDFPKDEPRILSMVAQFAVATKNELHLDQELRSIFDGPYEPTTLHVFLARLPALLRAKGFPRIPNPVQSRLIILTTNYDELLEEAFRRAREPYHLFSYCAEDGIRRMWHRDAKTGQEKAIDDPGRFSFDADDHYTAIVKLHGFVHEDISRETFVIAEDHYSDYLVHNASLALIPPALRKQLAYGQFLFLGYSLDDWTMRASIHWIWRQRRIPIQSYAIQLNPRRIEVQLWEGRDVRIIQMALKDCVSELGKRL